MATFRRILNLGVMLCMPVMLFAAWTFCLLTIPEYCEADDSGNWLAPQIISLRRSFWEKYANVKGFLMYIENAEPELKATNNSVETVEWSSCPLFYNRQRIEREIGIREGDPDRGKVKKIYTFVKTHSVHTIPLYESIEQHNPTRFFSVYGTGICDDLATNMAFLCAEYGFKARAWWLSGHVVADVFYNDGWHIYDPDSLGIIEYNGTVAGIEDMVLLARRNELQSPSLNKIYRTVEDNQVLNNYPAPAADDPVVSFFPKESRLFFDQAFLLSTDGHYLNTVEKSSDFLEIYKNLIANYVRVIPLDEKILENGKLSIEDYFPISGAFIRIPFSIRSIQPKIMPKVKVEADFQYEDGGERKEGTVRQMVDAEELALTGLKYRYLNLNLGIKTLESMPSRKIEVQIPDGFLKNFENARLITVHYYSLKNVNFEKAIDDIDKPGKLRVSQKVSKRD